MKNEVITVCYQVIMYVLVYRIVNEIGEYFVGMTLTTDHHSATLVGIQHPRGPNMNLPR
jgi:hypothetical protein